MTERIHPSWLKPMPNYWSDWSYRDDPRIAADVYFVPDPNLPEPRICEHCNCWYQPRGHNVRKWGLRFCQDADCQNAARRLRWREARERTKAKGG